MNVMFETSTSISRKLESLGVDGRLRNTSTCIHERIPAQSSDQASTISRGTTVPLTRTGPNPILHEIGHCPTSRHRRKLIERVGRDGVYRFGTGSSTELLDIGVLE